MRGLASGGRAVPRDHNRKIRYNNHVMVVNHVASLLGHF